LNRLNVAERNDAWFAHIVEGGNQFGMNLQTRNTGVIERSIKATEQSVSKTYAQQLKLNFPRYMK
jgi:hypothetical protein